ncbi:hypothetical protein J8281_14630 [Aquimarina sp. U1-2]|uniref:hypothetical protein n=1 Tax=Aquimarina sp. U1-2 TaxID=2823141 RepID=UPI001AEC7F91|nr:hypothetical protein [Aquimarina sp. U1-2]MBP2833428.1 hypothetical protein [Aquimarina sp. U1-2]
MNTNTNYILFKKKRELGEILSDTFAFIRQEGKSLFTVLIKTSGLPFVLLLAASAYYTYTSTAVFDPVSLSKGELTNSGSFMISLGLMLILAVVCYGLFFGSVLNYIKVYIEHKGAVDSSLVIQGVKKDFGNILALGLISGLIMMFGFALCILPGIYLYVPMSLVFAIMIFRNVSISDSISESFQLVKNEWWITFATLFVIALLIWVIGLIFSIPATVYGLTKTFTAASEGSLSDPYAMIDWVFIVLSTLASAAKYVLYTVTVISSAFIYFNLNERKYATGALEQIDKLGTQS